MKDDMTMSTFPPTEDLKTKNFGFIMVARFTGIRTSNTNKVKWSDVISSF